MNFTPNIQTSADLSSRAEVSAVIMSSRLYFDFSERALLTHLSIAIQLLTSTSSNRHPLGTVYAICPLRG
jgi:hypothetical protein